MKKSRTSSPSTIRTRTESCNTTNSSPSFGIPRRDYSGSRETHRFSLFFLLIFFFFHKRRQDRMQDTSHRSTLKFGRACFLTTKKMMSVLQWRAEAVGCPGPTKFLDALENIFYLSRKISDDLLLSVVKFFAIYLHFL